MGLRTGVNFVSWFITTMLSMAIISAIILLFIKLGGLMRHSSIIILYLYFLDFSFSTTMMW